MVPVRHASKIEPKYGMLVRFKVRGTQYANSERTVPYFHPCLLLSSACFSEGKLRVFEAARSHRVAQDNFDDMPSTSSKQISCRLTNIFNLIFIFLVFRF